MLKPAYLLCSLLVFSTHSFSFEPQLQQQGMFYVNVSFDAGQGNKTRQHFGFRFDQGLVKPGEAMTPSYLAARAATLDIQYGTDGMQAFNVHGINYLREVIVTRGAEAGASETGTAAAQDAATEAAEETVVTEPVQRRELNIPFGVVLGLGIGALAIAGNGK